MHTSGYTNFSDAAHTERFEMVVRIVVTTQVYEDAADVERHYVEQTVDEWEGSHDLQLESLRVTDVIQLEPDTETYVRQRGLTAANNLKESLASLRGDGLPGEEPALESR